MAKVRMVLLSVALLAAIGVGAAKANEREPQRKFCTAEGVTLDGEWLTKDEDCNWTKPDGTPVVDRNGDPVNPSTPAEDLPDGWGA